MRGPPISARKARTRLSSNWIGLMHHQERAFPYAHPGLRADQLVVKPEGVSGLQAGILQRIFHTFEGDVSGGTREGEDRDAVPWSSSHRLGSGLDHEHPPPVGHDRGTQADPLGGEQDVRSGEEGPEPSSYCAEEVRLCRPLLPGGQYREMAVHLVFPHRMALQGGSASLDLPREVFPQRVHVSDEEIRHDPGLQRVTRPTVGGDYQVRKSGDVPDQIRRVGRAVQEDRGPQATRSWSPGTAVASARAVLLRAPSTAPP